MTPDDLQRGNLCIVSDSCILWITSGGGEELFYLPIGDQEAIVLDWLRRYRESHQAFVEREALKRQHGSKLVFLDEERTKGRRKGKHGR